MGCGVCLLCAGALAGEPRVVSTGQMEVEFQDGWLTRWKNKLTDEEIRFGGGKPIPEAAGSELLKTDETTAALTQGGSSVWAVRVPRERTTLEHAEAGVMRQRYVLIQARASGLLVMLDDARQNTRATLERAENRKESGLTFRAAGTTPDREPARWLIRQYIGGPNWGIQQRLNYLMHSQSIIPPDKRPTAWAQNVVLIVTDPPWSQPVSGLGWGKSFEVHHAWLDNLQRVVDPDKLMFCFGNWRRESGAADPFTVLMAGRVRRAGYHLMLRLPWPGMADEASRQAAVGEALAAVRALNADAVLLENPARGTTGDERPFFQLLRAELDQNDLTSVALGVEGEAPEAALPWLDFAGGDDMALGTLTQKMTPAVRFSLGALLTDEELQTFALPPHSSAILFTRQQFGTFALARWWGENQPRLLEPKFFEPGDIARYRLLNDHVIRWFRTASGAQRLVFDNGEVLAELVNGAWTNNAALLEQHGPVFLKDRIGP